MTFMDRILLGKCQSIVVNRNLPILSYDGVSIAFADLFCIQCLIALLFPISIVSKDDYDMK